MLKFYSGKKRKCKLRSLYHNKTVQIISNSNINLSLSEEPIICASVIECIDEVDDDNYDDNNDSDYADNSTPTQLMHQDIRQQLTNAKLIDHLCFEKSPQAITTILNRVSTFIVWAFNKGQETLLTGASNSIDAMFILHKFITVNYQIVGEFCSYLRDELNFEYSTVSNWVFDIKKVCEWFAVFRADRHSVYITSASEYKNI
jgi:hypothetical protein